MMPAGNLGERTRCCVVPQLDWGLASVDLGPTAFAFKEALGAVLSPTEYHLRFGHWYLRPLSAALRWRSVIRTRSGRATAAGMDQVSSKAEIASFPDPVKASSSTIHDVDAPDGP
jgi:hypothetical protein